MGEIIEITTNPYKEKQYYHISGHAITFEVKGRSDAGVILAHSPKSHSNIEVTIADNGIYCSIKGYNDVVRVLKPNLLSEEVYKKFWLTWIDGHVTLGQDGSAVPILKFQVSDIDVNVVWFTSKNNRWHPLNWRFELPPLGPSKELKTITGGEPKWLPLINNELPEDAIIAGYEEEPLFIIRAYHMYSLTPGKYLPSIETGFIPWGGESHPKEISLEILCGYNFFWMPRTDHTIPVTAVVGGYSERENEELYIGRAVHGRSLIVGKVQPSHKGLYIPAESEVFKNKFEILVCPSYVDKRCIDPLTNFYKKEINDDSDYIEDIEDE